MQIFIYCKVTLHVSGVTAPIIRSTKNCNRNLRYSYFPPTWPGQATLEGNSCASIMTCTGGCDYSSGHVGGKKLYRYYDLYWKLRLPQATVQVLPSNVA